MYDSKNWKFFSEYYTDYCNNSSIPGTYSLYKKTIHSTNLGEENCQDYQTIGSKQSLWMWEYINLFDDIMCYFSVLSTEYTLRNNGK